MSMQYIRDYYKVPAKRGGRVVYTGDGSVLYGTIVGTSGPHLRIRMDGETRPRIHHPTDRLRYLDQIKDAGEYGPTSEVLVKSLRILMGTK